MIYIQDKQGCLGMKRENIYLYIDILHFKKEHFAPKNMSENA